EVARPAARGLGRRTHGQVPLGRGRPRVSAAGRHGHYHVVAKGAAVTITAVALLLLSALASGAAPLSTSLRQAYAVALPDLKGEDADRRIAKIRRDQDASRVIETAWAELQDPRLDETSRKVKRLVMQIAAAIARTEEAPVGGRTATEAGRAKARQLATEAIALAPGSPDAHNAMGDVLLDARDVEEAEAEYRRA